MAKPTLLASSVALVLAACTLTGRAAAQQSAPPPTLGASQSTAGGVDRSPHRQAVVSASGVRLEYLDWGGNGVALVFIPGIGNTAHVFDDFAPRFTDRYRVIGITRAGFGGSDRPDTGAYTPATRVAQITAVLDSLHIQRAVLVGHALAGEEITDFALAHPERTAGLIYLDAAYDPRLALQSQRAMAPFAAGAPRPAVTDFAGIDAFRAFQKRATGVEMPVGEVLATMRIDSTGRVVGQRTPPAVFMSILTAFSPLTYSSVHAPALAIYFDWTSAGDLLPWLRSDSTQNAIATGRLQGSLGAMQQKERTRFSDELKGGRVELVRGGPFLFLSDPQAVERSMRVFLDTLRGGGR